MGTDSFDASIGLAFSLKAFEKYRKNGLLQAEIHHVPGIRGRCKGYLQLIEGKVAMCYIEDNGGYRHAMPISVLIQLDNERGPFDWMLAPLAAPHMASTPRHEPRVPTPRIVALLDLEKLVGWSSEHKHILFQVYQAINGQRNIEDIKHALPFPPYVTEEALHVLSTLKIITESQT